MQQQVTWTPGYLLICCHWLLILPVPGKMPCLGLHSVIWWQVCYFGSSIIEGIPVSLHWSRYVFWIIRNEFAFFVIFYPMLLSVDSEILICHHGVLYDIGPDIPHQPEGMVGLATEDSAVMAVARSERKILNFRRCSMCFGWTAWCTGELSEYTGLGIPAWR